MAAETAAAMDIVVLGAGVVGLTTALRLLQAGYRNVTIVAKHTPSDRDALYTSPWAGAIFVPESEENTREQAWELASWEEFCVLAKSEPGAGVWFQDKFSFYCEQDQPQHQANDWWKDLVLNYRRLSRSEVPDFADWGIKYRTLALDPDIYLHYLMSRCLSLGARLDRREVAHIRDAFTLQSPNSELSTRAHVVINCAGLGVRTLGGVADSTVYPVRGQLVIVENPSHGMYLVPYNERLNMDKATGETSYIIERPAGGGTALGGMHHALTSPDMVDLYQPPDQEVAQAIMRRAIQICPSLVPANAGIEALRVVRHQVGYRAYRKDGPRVELENIQSDQFGPMNVVHSYGIGGTGYQLSYGVADEAVKLVASLAVL